MAMAKKWDEWLDEQTEHATMKIKYKEGRMDTEKIPFEELISREDTLIRIDFPNGKSLVEKSYKKEIGETEKLYIEFFDKEEDTEIMDYLLDEKSDYRVTNVEGTVIRLSKKDEKDFEKKETRKEEKTRRIPPRPSYDIFNWFQKIAQKKGK